MEDKKNPGTAKDLAGQICDTAIMYAGNVIPLDGTAWESLIAVPAAHKKGVAIVHAARKMNVMTLMANYAFDLAKPQIKQQVRNVCNSSIVNQAQTCTTDLKHGFFDTQTDQVIKSMTAQWVNSITNQPTRRYVNFSFLKPT